MSATPRIIDIVLPKGGLVVALYEAYFDESGDADVEGGILCVSGYVIESEAAKKMEAAWSAVLDKRGLDYFHMVDCAPAPGAGIFKGVPIETRIELVTELISLVKEFCITGISLFVRKESFSVSNAANDPYTQCAEICLHSIAAIVKSLDPKPQVAYFFEAGHSKERNAYRVLAQQAAKSGASVTFGLKSEVRLLQAADLLAWQSAKYVKDQTGKKRGPRKDFLSLMDHPHTFLFLTVDNDELIMQYLEWPLSRHRPDSPIYYRTKDVAAFFDPALLSNPDAPIVVCRFLPIWRAQVSYAREQPG
jgi:hypothetical protein